MTEGFFVHPDPQKLWRLKAKMDHGVKLTLSEQEEFRILVQDHLQIFKQLGNDIELKRILRIQKHYVGGEKLCPQARRKNAPSAVRRRKTRFETL